MRSLLLLSISLCVSLVPIPRSLGQTRSVPPHSEAPLELSLLEPGVAPNPNVITASTISQQNLTIPSLWWANQQFGGQLLENWLAYPADSTTAARIDLVVNRQNWSLSDYLERYEFVYHFGTVASDYGYNVRVFNYQRELLATYTCNFATSPRLCNLQLEATGRAQIRGSGNRI